MNEHYRPTKPRRVAIASIGASGEALGLRRALEEVSSWELPTDLIGIGRSRHLISFLGGEYDDADHLIIAGHGDGEGRGIGLPELALEIAAEEPYDKVFDTQAVRESVALQGQVVLSTCCTTAHLGEAFLERGASAYLAPNGDPYGEATFVFAVVFYYNLLRLDKGLRESFEAGRAVGGDTAMYELFTME